MTDLIALKIDIDTAFGAKHGVPALLALLKEHDAQATFFVALDKDETKEARKKEAIKRFYPLRYRLSSHFLPTPIVGKSARATLLGIVEAGFELGIRAGNAVRWEKNIKTASSAFVERELGKALLRCADLFPSPPKAHAACAFRTNRHALRLNQRLLFDYASDTRGTHPFIPVIEGEIVRCPQIPTTLPTLDELLEGKPKKDASDAKDRLMGHLDNVRAGEGCTPVFTLRAELEGMNYLSFFKAFLEEAKEAGYRFVSLRDVFKTLDEDTLPRHHIVFEKMTGRFGWQTVQGKRFP